MPPSRRSPTRRSLANFVPKFIWSIFSKPSPPTSVHPFVCYQPSSPTSAFREREISRPRNLRHSPHPAYRIAHPHFIHYLPFEILALIFVLAAEDDPRLPVSVSHVSRQWRDIALHTPSLWRRVSLSPHERLWRERIDRARACSLDVELQPWRATHGGGRRTQDLNAYTVQWYMYLVLPFIHRWRSLDILFTDYSPYLWRAALAGCGSPAPELEELSLVYRFNDNTQEFLLFAEDAPRLRRLTVDGIRLAWTPRLFANLTYLDYTHHGFTSGHQAVHDVVTLLSVSTRLVDLRILFPRGQVASLPPRRDYVTKRVRLRHLENLQLTVDGSDIPFELAHLATLISSRHLKTLRLVDLGHSYHPFPCLKSFFYIFPLPQSLDVIHIGHGWYDHRMIQPMTQSLPQMSKIVIKRAKAPEQVLELTGRRIKETPTATGAGAAERTHGHGSSLRHYQYHMNPPSVPYYPGVMAH